MSSLPVSVIAASELRHRLRTPLNHIIGYSEILLEEYPQAAGRNLVEAMVNEATAMVDTIQHVAGGEHLSVPAIAMQRLREYLEPRIQSAGLLLSQMDGCMPPAARQDLDRIGVAIQALTRTLVDGAIASAPPRPHPMETPVELRPSTFAGGGRILVVDDDEMNRDMLSRQLERQKHEVVTAADGATALELLRTSRFDIVLLDLMMPRMNGFEVLEQIKSDPSFGAVAVILVSALDEMDSVVRSIEAGAEDYLFKPVNPTLLRARIKSTLEKLRAEESVRRKQRLESIGLLAAGIAHDFNNLLTGIIGHAQLLEQVLTQTEDRAMVEAIVNSGERAAELTRQLLAYSGKAMFQMKPMDLARLIRESEGLVRASLPRKVHLDMRLGTTPAVIADQNQIRQVLLNLVLNAAEAIGTDTPGTVTVETGAEKVTADMRFDLAPDEPRAGWHVWFEVLDSGCGMDPETVSKMFEPFFTTKFLGRGLGLAALAGIVRAHHAMLRVTAAPGQGCSVRVYFPAVVEEDGDDAKPKSGPYILVVDDEPVVRQIVKVTLERAGRRVLLAESGESALETFQRFSGDVDVILLDWKMPVMNGSQALSLLRAIRPDVKVIVSSGLSQPEAEERFRESRVNGFLQKPYRMSELVAIIEKTVGKLS